MKLGLYQDSVNALSALKQTLQVCNYCKGKQTFNRFQYEIDFYNPQMTGFGYNRKSNRILVYNFSRIIETLIDDQ